MIGVGELDGMTDTQLTERFRELELTMRRSEAEMARLVAEVDRRGSWDVDGHRSIRGWMKANANWSNHQVTHRRRLARLVATIPEAGDALADGHIGIAQAEELARARANPRCGDQLEDAADVLLEHAEHLSYEHFRTCVRRWEILADADGAHRDRDRNHENRTALVTELDGATHISASGGTALDAAEFQAIFDRFLQSEFDEDVAARTEAYGPNAPADLLPRSNAQRSYDALRSIFRAAAAAGPDAARPVDVLINVVVDQFSYELALAGHQLLPEPNDLVEPPIDRRRSETDTGIALTPADVVQASLRGLVRRAVMDTAGVIVDLGRRQRLFTGGARDAAKLMASRCDHPGCDVPITGTEVDHAAEWVRDHGHTNPGNATNTCRAHNKHKHRAGVTVTRSRSGYLIFRRHDGSVMSPVGRRPPPSDDPPDQRDELRFAEAAIDALSRFGSDRSGSDRAGDDG